MNIRSLIQIECFAKESKVVYEVKILQVLAISNVSVFLSDGDEVLLDKIFHLEAENEEKASVFVTPTINENEFYCTAYLLDISKINQVKFEMANVISDLFGTQ